jgi:aspartyl-tRNA(Asn)/glutamyl-tRNA(Gln) amidotransferase subunit A
MRNDIPFLSACELLDAYAKRALSPVEVTQTVLERIDALDPTLNAFLAVDHEGAQRAAKEAERAWASEGEKPLLCGVPISIKDLIYTSWLPTTHGSLLFKDYNPGYDSPVVERLLAAGAVVTGKTNTPEFGLVAETRNLLRDECVNPWNFEHTAGGSSGGAGAQVAAGMGPLAIGTDGAGSIRIPSYYNGIYGLKPTYGRVAHDGWKGAPYVSHQGPMTRTVRDAALIMQATSGPHERDDLCLREAPPDFLAALDAPRDWKGTKVGISLDYGYIDIDPEIRQAVLDAAELLRGFGCELIETTPPRREAAPGSGDFLVAEEVAYGEAILPGFKDRLDEMTDYARPAIQAGIASQAWQYAQGVRRREHWAAEIHRWFAPFDFFLSPVMGVTAPRCDQPLGLGKPGTVWAGSFLPIFNASGNPAASIPFGFHSNGLPLAIQIAGRGTDDAGVLQLSAAIEAARPWKDAWPAIAARENAPTRG